MPDSVRISSRLIFAAAIVPIAAVPFAILGEENLWLGALPCIAPMVAGFIVGRDRMGVVWRRGALAGALGMAFAIAAPLLASPEALEGRAVFMSACFVVFAGVAGAIGAILAYYQPRYED